MIEFKIEVSASMDRFSINLDVQYWSLSDNNIQKRNNSVWFYFCSKLVVGWKVVDYWYDWRIHVAYPYHVARPQMYHPNIGAPVMVCTEQCQGTPKKHCSWQEIASHSLTIFLLEEFRIHLKVDGSQTSSNSMMGMTYKLDCSDSVLSL